MPYRDELDIEPLTGEAAAHRHALVARELELVRAMLRAAQECVDDTSRALEREEARLDRAKLLRHATWPLLARTEPDPDPKQIERASNDLAYARAATASERGAYEIVEQRARELATLLGELAPLAGGERTPDAVARARSDAMRSAARLVDELAATATRADEHAASAQRDAIRAALAGAAVEDEALASNFAVATAELARARARLGLVRASLAPLYADDDALIVRIDGMLESFVEAVEAPTAAWRTRVAELRADVDSLARAVAGTS